MAQRGDPKLEYIIDAVCKKVHETFPRHGIQKLCLRPEICPSNIIDIVMDPKPWSTYKLEVKKGDVNRCHWNCVDLFQEYPRGEVQICVGFYAFRPELLGRIHTWLVHKDGHIIETIRRADIYVGSLLSLEQCDMFVKESEKTRP
jgi:hypothetical protein